MKHTGVLLLKYAAKALLNFSSAGLVPSPVVDAIVDGGESVAKDFLDWWATTPENEQREAIVEVAKATDEESRLVIKQIVNEVAGEYPEKQPALQALLPQFQANIRRTLRRPDDPTGTSIAAWQKFDSVQALLPLIPTKPARFQAGQRPLPGIDLELTEQLGQGGFGEVWRAKNPFMSSAPDVALKFCLDAAAAKTLRNEAALLDRIVQQGKHPGIVELRQTYLSAEVPALQYEYVAGGDLADLINQWYAQPTPPSIAAVRSALIELSDTLAFAHAAGIVHRDLKPANILIPVTAAFARLPKSSETSEVSAPRFKIADFGIGSIQAEIDHRTQRTHTVGRRMAQSMLGSHTPLYASPEQANGEVAHTADDIYSLGVIWYQMLTGDLNSAAPTGSKWRGRLQDRGMSETEIDLLTSCFDSRADRPQNAGELAQQLIVAVRSVNERSAPDPPATNNEKERSFAEQKATIPAPLASAPPASGGRQPSEFPRARARARELILPGGVKHKQLWCPPGTFLMGSPAFETGHKDNEEQVSVELTQGFWLGQTTITQAMWTAVMKTTPWVEHRDKSSYNKSSYKVGPDYPAVCVNHADATAFCEEVTKIELATGRLPADWKYALPTEAQWEYACRAGTSTAYSFGDDVGRLGQYAWYHESAKYIGEDYAHVVGTKRANPWGFYDLHGNVWEWCRDGYEVQLPGGRDPFVSPAWTVDRVYRGGGWLVGDVFCRSAARCDGSPLVRYAFIGFRLATVPVE